MILRRVKHWLDRWRGSHDSSRDDNRLHGRFYVDYLDGTRSEPMFYSVATDYTEIFHGEVKWLGNSR